MKKIVLLLLCAFVVPAITMEPNKRKIDEISDGSVNEQPNKKSKTADSLSSVTGLLLPPEEIQNPLALHDAARSGNVDMVRVLLCCGADVNRKNNSGTSPLHLAAENGHAEIAQLLMESLAEVNSVNNETSTPLHLAAVQGHAAVVSILLECRANLNAEDDDGMTPLHCAAENGRCEVAQLLLKSGAEVNAETHYYKLTPLHLVALEGHAKVAQLLLDNSADVNALDAEGCTPLYLAVENNNIEVAQLLIKSGANVDLHEDCSGAPLHVAAQKGNIEMVHLLISAGADIYDENGGTGHRPLDEALQCDHVAVAKLLIDSGTNYDRTPLIKTASYGNIELTQWLIDRGADVHSIDDEGNTPLHNAAKKGFVEVVRLLIAAGADVHSKDDKGNTPLHNAVYFGHTEVVQLLLEYGADLKAKNVLGHSPLHSAAYYNQANIVKLFVKIGSELESQTGDSGETPFLTALLHGHLEIVKVLIAAGANVNATYHGDSALHLYAKHLIKYPSLISLERELIFTGLLSIFCDYTIKNRDDKTAGDIFLEAFNVAENADLYQAFSGKLKEIPQIIRDNIIECRPYRSHVSIANELSARQIGLARPRKIFAQGGDGKINNYN